MSSCLEAHLYSGGLNLMALLQELLFLSFPAWLWGLKFVGRADNLGVRIRGTLEALCQNGALAFRGFKVSD